MSADSYMIYVTNRSGYTSNYFIFAYAAEVKPALKSSEIQMSVLTTLRSVPGSNGTAAVKIPKELTAICGTICSTEGKVYREVLDRRPIECAEHLEDGTLTEGTALTMAVNDTQPFFHSDQMTRPTARTGTYTLSTRPDFTYNEAKTEEMVAGLTGPWQGPKQARAFGYHLIFTPRPFVRYEIAPRPVFGIAIGDLEARDHFEPEGYDICTIDFENLLHDEVEVIHDDRNRLRIQP